MTPERWAELRRLVKRNRDNTAYCLAKRNGRGQVRPGMGKTIAERRKARLKAYEHVLELMRVCEV